MVSDAADDARDANEWLAEHLLEQCDCPCSLCEKLPEHARAKCYGNHALFEDQDWATVRANDILNRGPDDDD
jgi:hypothetical protein